MKKTDAELKEFEATNSARLLVQEATAPILSQFGQVVAKVNQFHDKLLLNSEKIAEIEAFFRRISFFQRDFNKLWNQVQELEMQRVVNERRREVDLKEIANNTDKLKAIIDNMKTSTAINAETIRSLAEQHNELVTDTVAYKEGITAKCCEAEATACGAKELCTASIEAVQAKVLKISNSSDRYTAQFAKLEAELQISNQRMAGTFSKAENRARQETRHKAFKGHKETRGPH